MGLSWPAWLSNAIAAAPPRAQVAEDHAVVKEGVSEGFIA